MSNKAVVPVFSASKAGQCAAGNRVTFAQLDIETDEAHGSFDKTTGIFTAKTAGIYQINFNGVASSKGYSVINLRVNEIDKANSYNDHAHSTEHYCSIVVSPMLKLKSGDRVDVFIKYGTLYEGTGVFTFFSAILLSY